MIASTMRLLAFLFDAQSFSSSCVAAQRWRLEQVDAVVNDPAYQTVPPALRQNREETWTIINDAVSRAT